MVCAPPFMNSKQLSSCSAKFAQANRFPAQLSALVSLPVLILAHGKDPSYVPENPHTGLFSHTFLSPS